MGMPRFFILPRPRLARRAGWAGLGLALAVLSAGAAEFPVPKEADGLIPNFKFKSGETLPALKIHYRVFGAPERDANGLVRNAVLIMHGTAGSGAPFITPEFAGELFGTGQPLDVAHTYVVIPDAIGHGGSSKPSNGLKGHFPHYGYPDMVEADYRLLTEVLKVNHLRLVMGTSMGGMKTWLWGEMHPDFMDALMPLASVPAQISGRNRVWRRMVIDAIQGDPEWHGGDYTREPPSLRLAAQMLFFVAENPVLRYQAMPTLKRADKVLDAYVDAWLKTGDANDVLYAFSASSDYNPGPGLERIRAPLLAINSADDLINPPELGILEKEIKRLPQGRAVIIPFSDQTHGHQTHTHAAVWKEQLVQLLKETAHN